MSQLNDVKLAQEFFSQITGYYFTDEECKYFVERLRNKLRLVNLVKTNASYKELVLYFKEIKSATKTQFIKPPR